MDNQAHPLISVVIPTHNRSDLLMNRSLPSALAQWYSPLEVIVVIDGPDAVTEAALTEIERQDSRVRSVRLPRNMGGSDARNAGVQAARGKWIAFLDDDDEWLPRKLEEQLRAGLSSHHLLPVITCAWLTRTNHGEFSNTPRNPHSGETFGDYLLLRPSLNERNYSFPSSTLLAPTELLKAVPFTSGLIKHQDTDWLLHASEYPGYGIEVVPDVHLIYYLELGRFQLSWQNNWEKSIQWMTQHQKAGRISKGAAVSFIISYLTPLSARPFNLITFLKMFWQLISLTPRVFEIFRFLAIWLFPPATRSSLLAHHATIKNRNTPTATKNISVLSPSPPINLPPRSGKEDATK